uniref:Carboxylic ester hydrolase n=1 Tax=Plutella xylostella TaxID=51655 RepID=A0A1L8D6I3_PLUXY
MAAVLWFASIILFIAGSSASDYSNREFKKTCDNGLPVKTNSGLVCGEVRQYKNTTFGSFRGVPYARPPLGELRYKKPRKAKSWDDYLDASSEGSICPQSIIIYGPLMEPKGIGEDCLNANVYVPLAGGKIPRKKRLPILVYIHGGGFAVGSGDSDIHGPEYFLTRDVVVVTFNYRLGALGFLSLNTSSVPGNNGLRDQLYLLRWVQKNGKRFGGDINDVTIFGQSAGAACVHLLTLSPLTQDRSLFQKAILMSGSAVRSFYNYEPEVAATVATSFLTLMGINATDPDAIYQQLLAADTSQYIEATRQIQEQTGLPPFAPVVESIHEGVTRVIDMDPDQLIAAGRGQQIPLLISFTELECGSLKARINETDLPGKLDANSDLALPSVLQTAANKAELAVVVKDRYFAGPNATLDEFVNFCSDSLFKYPAIYTAQRRAQLGGAESFLYQFAYRAENRILESLGFDIEEAGHIEDLTTVFKPNSNVSIPEEVFERSFDRVMQDWTVDILVNFIKNSAPAPSTLAWPPVSRFPFRYQDVVSDSYKLSSLQADASTNEMVQFYTELFNNATSNPTA